MKKRRGWKRFCIVMVCLIVFGSIPGYALNGGDAEGAKIGYSPEQALASEQNGKEYTNIKDLKFNPEDGIVLEDWYSISDADGLIRFTTLVNDDNYANFRSMKVCLSSDIDMKNKTNFVAIGMSAQKMFQGEFDGCGYKIDNLAMENSSDTSSYLSLFGVVGASAKIKNLVIGENCSFKYGGNSQYSYTAALASKVTEGAMIENILSVASVSGGYYSGGLIAKLENGDRNSNTQSLTMSNCSNAGNVDGRYAVGGLIGFICGSVQIKMSRNSGKISGISNGAVTEAYVGGLIGRRDWVPNPSNNYDKSQCKVTVTFGNVVNCGNVLSASTAGGLIGSAKIDGIELDGRDETIQLNAPCVNEGSVSATSENGKSHTFIGDADGTVDFTGCTDRSGEVRLHGSQVRCVSENRETYDVRFIGSISSLEYQEIGFNVTIKWNGQITEELKMKCDVAFSSIETAGTDGMEYTAEALRGSDPAYLYAVTVSDIPMDAGTVEFCIAPYGIRTGKTEPEVGEECTVIYCNGEFVPTWERAVA